MARAINEDPPLLPLVKALLDVGAGADAVLTPDKEERPLHVAASRSADTVVNLLMKRGASVDSRNSKGRTLLHRAAKGGHLTVCTVLLLRGADVEAWTRDEATPRLLARRACNFDKFQEVVKALLSFKAKVEGSFGAGIELEDSVMGMAICRDKDVILRLLLDHGAAPIFEARYGVSIIEACLGKRAKDCLRMLLTRPESRQTTQSTGHRGITARHCRRQHAGDLKNS